MRQGGRFSLSLGGHPACLGSCNLDNDGGQDARAPSRDARIPAILDEAHTMMFDEPQKRLSQS